MTKRIRVLLWFDTEDYILPASDDALLRLARFLTGEGVRATFKMVGEKARMLERRGRNDVTTALKKHEIGYHTDFHSIPPTPAQYLANLGWDSGVAEFDRRERGGFGDVRRIFGVTPSCYGQPGSSWGPQAYGAMKNWGVGVYLDAGRHVDLNGRPCFYCGALNLLHLTHTIRTELDRPADLETAEKRFLAARESLLAENGGLVSVYYHPCEFVHRKFWDMVNFARGANPPREKWRLPPVKTAAGTRTAFANYEGFVQFMKKHDDVEFITARQAADLYRDGAQVREFDRAELIEIAKRAGGDAGYQEYPGWALAASEVFALLNEVVAERGKSAVVLKSTPLGPVDPSPALKSSMAVDRGQFLRTAVDVAQHLRTTCRIPSVVWLGSRSVPPESYLRSLASVAALQLAGRPVPEKIGLKRGRLAAGRHVATDSPGLWGWTIFPPGFRAPEMMELAHRMAWTLKPAILR
jgi:hypothetical protein